MKVSSLSHFPIKSYSSFSCPKLNWDIVYPNGVAIVSMELHGFSDASEEAYAAVVYLRMIDSQDNIHTSLVTSKTRVSPIEKLTIPRLELCGALLLSRLLNHVKGVFGIPVMLGPTAL